GDCRARGKCHRTKSLRVLTGSGLKTSGCPIGGFGSRLWRCHYKPTRRPVTGSRKDSRRRAQGHMRRPCAPEL
ncbi:hypothetical protein BGZ94_006621, partial [Podila epigama]